MAMRFIGIGQEHAGPDLAPAMDAGGGVISSSFLDAKDSTFGDHPYALVDEWEANPSARNIQTMKDFRNKLDRWSKSDPRALLDVSTLDAINQLIARTDIMIAEEQLRGWEADPPSRVAPEMAAIQAVLDQVKIRHPRMEVATLAKTNDLLRRLDAIIRVPIPARPVVIQPPEVLTSAERLRKAKNPFEEFLLTKLLRLHLVYVLKPYSEQQLDYYSQ